MFIAYAHSVVHTQSVVHTGSVVHTQCPCVGHTQRARGGRAGRPAGGGRFAYSNPTPVPHQSHTPTPKITIPQLRGEELEPEPVRSNQVHGFSVNDVVVKKTVALNSLSGVSHEDHLH